MPFTESPTDPERRIIVAGYAKMPQGTAVRAMYETVTLGVLVRFATHTIEKVWCTLMTPGGREWVEEHLLGECLLDERSTFVAAVERDFWGQAAPALIQAHRDLVRRYRRGLEQEGNLPAPGAAQRRD